jgi:hypothetical protein
MSHPEFVGYVGDPDFHDGRIVSVEPNGGDLTVVVQGASGRRLLVSFSDVQSTSSKRPEGMVLYALSEMRGAPPWRRFSFANWDETDDAYLEVVARDFRVEKAGEGN